MATHSSAHVIDPATLTRAQRAGRRCAIPNCRRPLFRHDPEHLAGHLPDGSPVRVCSDCAPVVSFSPRGQLVTEMRDDEDVKLARASVEQ
jgi:hypothetical protein